MAECSKAGGFGFDLPLWVTPGDLVSVPFRRVCGRLRVAQDCTRLVRLVGAFRRREQAMAVPVIESVVALADWLALTPNDLRWFADLRSMTHRPDRQQLGHYAIMCSPSA